jgi:hypothetical protein
MLFWLSSKLKSDGVAKNVTCCVAVFFQDFDIRLYAFALEKALRLAGHNFCLAIWFLNQFFYESLKE